MTEKTSALQAEVTELRAGGEATAGKLKAAELAFSPFTKSTELPPDAAPVDLAAWAIVARVLLTLDETLTKG